MLNGVAGYSQKGPRRNPPAITTASRICACSGSIERATGAIRSAARHGSITSGPSEYLDTSADGWDWIG